MSIVQSESETNRVAVLDGIRGLAVLLVLMNHLLTRGDANQGLRSIPFKIAEAGWIGVDLFFVLSGFLITSILLRDLGSPHYFRNFYVRRVLRIFPLYYGALIAVFLIVPRIVGVTPAEQSVIGHQHFAWLYVMNFAPFDFRGGWIHIGHFWSLSIEEQFYFVWPLILFLSGRKAAIRIAIGAIALSIALRFLLSTAALSDPRFVWLAALGCFDWTPCRFDGLAAGALVAMWSRDSAARAWMARAAGPVALASGLILAGLTWRGAVENVLARPVTPLLAFSKVAGFTFFALFFAALIAFVTQKGTVLSTVLATPALRFLGRYSYGLYVFHGLLLPVFERRLPRELLEPLAGGRAAGAVLYFVITSSVSLAAAMLSFHLFESPFLRLKRHFEPEKVSKQAPDLARVCPSLVDGV